MTSADFSAEEGEIPEAFPLPRFKQEALVDRVERTRSSRPNDYEHSNDVRVNRRSRSPRGFKRPLDDRDRHDEKKFRPSSEYSDRENRRWTDYDDPQPAYRRSHRPAYQDLDRPQPRGARENERPSSYRKNGNGNGYSRHHNSRPYDERRNRQYDRDMYSDDSRSRYRSRSPGRRDDRGRRDRERDRAPNPSDFLNAQIGSSGSHWSSHDISSHEYAFASLDQAAKSKANGRVEERINTLSISQATHEESPAQAEPDVDWDPDQEQDEEAEIERRRRARQAVLKRALEASHQASATSESPQLGTPAPAKSDAETPHSLDDISEAASDTFDESAAPFGNGPSAADYDPTADMREDERRDEMRHGNVGLHGEPRDRAPVEEPRSAQEEPGALKGAENEYDFDMFEDEIDDGKMDKFSTAVASKLHEEAQAQIGGRSNIEGADKDGYYKMRPGDLLGSHYRIMNELGRGAFSNVARAEDLRSKKVVAVKIMRNNAALKKGGFTEIAILKKLNKADPENKKHIIRFENHFLYRGHLCMVFENLDLNLREVVKKYGKDTGINLHAVQRYAHQIFTALAHMRKHDIIHADLKPDNILVDQSRTMLKICDLGTAIDRSDALTSASEVTPYLVSRFYRAPEVILGIPYTCAIDMWSIGCTLYELYTGKILFTGSTNNQMLKTIQETRGPLKGVARASKAARYFEFFNGNGHFVSKEPSNNADGHTLKIIEAFPQTDRLRRLLVTAARDTGEDRHEDLNNFTKLLEQCLTLNQDKRITPEDALHHEFFKSMTKYASTKQSGAGT